MEMETNSIDIISKFSDDYVPIEIDTYVTRPNISLMTVYECVSFLSSMKDKPNTNDIQVMLDLVVRIYDDQFTKRELMNGLSSQHGTHELYEQILFVASGKNADIDNDVKQEVEGQEVSSWQDYKSQLNDLIKDMTKDGKDINEVLNLPFIFMMNDLQQETKKVERQESMLDAFM